MKKILLWLIILIFTAALGRAQDTATQQQLDKLSGQIQDLIEAQAQQGKRVDAMEREISELRDKVNTPAVSDSASRDDLKKLAGQVQELANKQQDDNALIVKQLEKLAKAAAIAPLPPRKPKASPEPLAAGGDNSTSPPAGPENGHYYFIKKGDLFPEIVKAYQDQGVKVTKAQILQANPGLDPNKLYVGKKIFIPDPAAK